MELRGTQTVGSGGTVIYDLAAESVELQTAAEPREWQLAWALYSFENLIPGALPALVETQLGGEVPGEYFIGISDYKLGLWRWTRVSASDGSDHAPVANAGAINAQSGRLYVVVVCFGGNWLRLDRLSLQGEIDLPPPVEFTASTDLSDRIELRWEDPALTYDPDGEGPGVFTYTHLYLLRASDPRGPWLQAAQLPAGTTSQVIWPYGDEPEIGEAQYFRLATGTALVAGPPGNAVRGLRSLPAPTGLAASNGDYLDRIDLSWTPVPGAASYEVYARQAGGAGEGYTLLGKSGGSCLFFHTLASPVLMPARDNKLYEYRVKAVHLNGARSEFSGMVAGRRLMQQVQDLTAVNNPNSEKITLTWQRLSHPLRYHIRFRRSAHPEEPYYELWSDQDASSKVLTSETFQAGEEYSFWVAGALEGGASTEFGPYSEPAGCEFHLPAEPALTITPHDGLAPLPAILDASGSAWPGEAIASYGWDFDSDGVVDATTSGPQTIHEYAQGAHKTTVVLTTAEGETAFASRSVLSGGWAKGWSSAEGISTGERARVLDFDDAGNIYTAGEMLDHYFGTDDSILLVKRNPQGALVWARRVGPSYKDFYNDYRVDTYSWRYPLIACRAGFIWLLYLANDEANQYSTFALCKITQSGAFVWGRVLDDITTKPDWAPRSLAVAADGTAYVFGRSGLESQILVVDSEGEGQGTLSFSNTSNPDQGRIFLCFGALDAQDRPLVLGLVKGAPDTSSFCLLALNPDHSVAWQQAWEALDETYPRGLAASAAGGISVTLERQLTGQAPETTLLTFDPSGGLGWAKAPVFGSGADLNCVGIQADALGNIVLSLDGGLDGHPALGGLLVSPDGSAATPSLWYGSSFSLVQAAAHQGTLYICGTVTGPNLYSRPALCVLPQAQVTLLPSTQEVTTGPLLLADVSATCIAAEGTEDIPEFGEGEAMLLRPPQ